MKTLCRSVKMLIRANKGNLALFYRPCLFYQHPPVNHIDPDGVKMRPPTSKLGLGDRKRRESVAGEGGLKRDSCSRTVSQQPSRYTQIPGCAARLATLSKQTKRLCAVWCYVNWRLRLSSKSGSVRTISIFLSGQYAHFLLLRDVCQKSRGSRCTTVRSAEPWGVTSVHPQERSNQFRRHALDFKPQTLGRPRIFLQGCELASRRTTPVGSCKASLFANTAAFKARTQSVSVEELVLRSDQNTLCLRSKPSVATPDYDRDSSAYCVSEKHYKTKKNWTSSSSTSKLLYLMLTG